MLDQEEEKNGAEETENGCGHGRKKYIVEF